MPLHTTELVLFVISITLPNCKCIELIPLEFNLLVGNEFVWEIATKNARYFTSQWREYITNRNGVAIYRGNEVFDSPRMDRYVSVVSKGSTTLSIPRVQLDDGGCYAYVEAGVNRSILQLIVSGNHKCNLTYPHSIRNGTYITYTCQFVYQGIIPTPIYWEGPGVDKAKITVQTNESLEVVSTDCYTGKASYSITFLAHFGLNATTRTARQDSIFTYNTGTLTVRCPGGFGGPKCHTPLTCYGPYPPCQNGADCSSVAGFAACACKTLYTGYYCDVLKSCLDYPCENGASCTDVNTGGVICNCTRPYAGHLCRRLKDCIEQPCDNAISCTDRNGGGVTCQCIKGYAGDFCERLIECSDQPCQNNGSCTENVDGGVTCQCVIGYTGDYCQRLKRCSDNACENGASCIDGTGGGVTCICAMGYAGLYCERVKNCADDPCENGASCTYDHGGGVICQCTKRYAGVFCERFKECSEDPCENGGSCTDHSSAGGATCRCVDGYTGQFCEYKVGCKTGVCQNSGTCTNKEEGGFSCQCQSGYSGNFCEKKETTVLTSTQSHPVSTSISTEHSPQSKTDKTVFIILFLFLIIIPIMAFLYVLLSRRSVDSNDETFAEQEQMPPVLMDAEKDLDTEKEQPTEEQEEVPTEQHEEVPAEQHEEVPTEQHEEVPTEQHEEVPTPSPKKSIG